MESNSLLNRRRKGYLNPLRNPISNSDDQKALKIQENPLLKPISNRDERRDLIKDDDRILLEMESNSLLNRKRKVYLNLLRNLISNSSEWKALKIQENPLLKHVSNRDEWRDIIRDDDRLPSLNQFDQERDFELLLLFKYKLQILLVMVKLSSASEDYGHCQSKIALFGIQDMQEIIMLYPKLKDNFLYFLYINKQKQNFNKSNFVKQESNALFLFLKVILPGSVSQVQFFFTQNGFMTNIRKGKKGIISYDGLLCFLLLMGLLCHQQHILLLLLPKQNLLQQVNSCLIFINSHQDPTVSRNSKSSNLNKETVEL